MKATETKQLRTQMDDVTGAIGNLDLCLNLALHDEDQFIKEYGNTMYQLLVGLQRELNAWAN